MGPCPQVASTRGKILKNAMSKPEKRKASEKLSRLDASGKYSIIQVYV